MHPIQVNLSTKPKNLPDFKALGFGKYFTDHMFTAHYNLEKLWHKAMISPYKALEIDPGAACLHYGQALFEGIKAFKQVNGDIVIFRPEYNWQRLQRGAERLCMQAPPQDLMLEGIKALVRTDKRWIPTEKGGALYIRPTLIGSESFLGVRPSNEFIFFVILSPVGSYYSEGTAPIKIWIEDQDLRAAPGGLGDTKAGANYAASLRAAFKARQKGYAQVLWLDSAHENIEEVGTMNVFFVFDNEVVTPKLNGSILAGGVRDCAIKLLKKMNINVQERQISLKEIIEKYDQGKLKEVFGTGTAAVISPVGELTSRTKKMIINEEKIGAISQSLYQEITDIQYGEKPDTHNWTVKLGD